MRHSRHHRDAALQRISSFNKAVAFASLAAAAVLSLYFSRAFPGHVATPAGSAEVTVGGSQTGSGSSSGGQPTNTLAPPNSPPVQTQQPAPVVSGST